MDKKRCSACREKKPHQDFAKNKSAKDGVQSYCRDCLRGRYGEYKRQWARQHRGKGTMTEEVRKKYLECRRVYMRSYLKRDYVRAKRKKWQRGWYKNNPTTRMAANIGSHISVALRKNKNGRKWEELVGFTREELVAHLEKYFTPDMGWDNYGSYWHIDHRTPKSWFSYNTPEDEQFKECWALENLRPITAHDNMVKNNRFRS